jgi:hypothetical protein
VGGTLALGGLFNGSDNAPFASIRGGKQNSINNNYDGYLAFQTIANGGVLTEKMRIDSSGNVGIGTSSPAFKTDVVGDIHASSSVFTGSNTDGWGRFINSGGALYIQAGSLNSGAATAQPIIFTNMYGGSERMRIDSNGNVLVGRTSGTGAKLDVYNSGSGDATVRIGNAQNGNTTDVGKQGVTPYGATGAGEGFLYAGTSISIMADTGAGIIKFSAGGNTERMRISAPGYLEFPNSTFSRPGSTGQYIVGAANGGFYQQDGTNYYTVTTSGGSTSDATLKKDVQQLENALAKICAVRGVSFEFIEQPLSTSDCGTQIGVIAQEIEAQFPEIVVTHENGTKAVRYDRLVAPLIEAIKELTARVAQLEGN